MNETEARGILGNAIQPDNGLYDLSGYLFWDKTDGTDEITLDGRFSADDLEAYVWWMNNKGEKP